MIGIHVDGTVVSGEKAACEKFFAYLKERFPPKTGKNSRYNLVTLSSTNQTACAEN